MPSEPMFREALHVGRPNIGDRQRLLARLNGALDRRWLTNDGPLVREFEERLAALTRVRHCIATCNATTGIQVAARAAGLRAGDEVIVPSFTVAATPHALDWIGVVPVFCDIDEESGCVDPRHVEKLLGPQVRGILAVHAFGYPCQVEQLAWLARRHRLRLLFDAAHALGCTYRGSPIGGFGDAEVFSFHATKYVNSFEGGAIVTNDDGLAERARAMRTMGMNRHREVVMSGTVARMSEASAAMGLTSLEAMPGFITVNHRNYRRYQQNLAGVPGVRLRAPAPGEQANCQYLVVEVDAAVTGVSRDEVHARLTTENVLSRRYFHPGCHRLAPYRADIARHAPLPLPRTEALTERVLSLPTGTSIGEPEIDGICDIIRRTVSNPKEAR